MSGPPVVRAVRLGSLGIDPIPTPLPTPRPVTLPDVAALYAQYRGQLARVQQMTEAARVVRGRLAEAQRLGGLDVEPTWVKEVPGANAMTLAEADREFGRVLGELGKHAELVAGVEAKRLRVVASASTPGDIDLTASAVGHVGELGIWPLLVAGAAVLGRVIIAGAVAAVAYRTYEHLEFRTKARLLEQGKDIGKLEPPPDFGAKVAKVTTPIAIAAGVVGAALLIKAWKAK